MTDMIGASTDLIIQPWEGYTLSDRIGAIPDDTNPTKACITGIYNPRNTPITLLPIEDSHFSIPKVFMTVLLILLTHQEQGIPYYPLSWILVPSILFLN